MKHNIHTVISSYCDTENPNNEIIILSQCKHSFRFHKLSPISPMSSFPYNANHLWGRCCMCSIGEYYFIVDEAKVFQFTHFTVDVLP